MVPVTHYMVLSAILFGLSLVGIIINRRNVILLLICVELMLLAVNTNFVAFSHYYGDNAGQVFVFFILTVAAAEAAIGLAIVMLLYRNRGNIDVNKMNHLKG
ncbi:NADH dehydrogenase I subunit K (plasmid) [Legionella adelaidensis]|uniref:NADH-quinone oxidoreductase subunit K n=1 Tax=Legionella adelaidensis TaxID=45056 RepID=A0A0W0R0D5_9GAMM|nr:NADH-quinone oxidoreductase subunit NuoK [Legionella adelaidensis]KTC64559.1 NADH-quinone oxidoreductase chain K [Legionella adelaidensis]VEH85927.1 NADH dehydrogenase I subunit K [Legionella adelaidensis]